MIAIPLKTKKAKEVAEALFTHVFGVHGRPESIRSDEGKEFINKGLLHLYQRWGIQPITTGGWRPWSNPVERYHRYLNAGMTLLSSKYGENWTSYLQAVVFSYNASACESTGYSPYYMMHAREPSLLEEVAMERIRESDKTDDDMNAITKRLAEAYEHVLQQQMRVAELNRQRLDEKRRPIRYKKGDSVMYWEPAQTKSLHADPDEENDEILATKRAPGKWTPKWTGPHIIEDVKPGKYNPRYTIKHNTRKKLIENVKADKLTPYQPWSTSIASTAPELDAAERRKFEIGSWCKEGDMLIVPLDKPWPFGVGQALETTNEGKIIFQWYASTHNTAATKPFIPMWKSGKSTYAAKTKKAENHTPFTNTDDEMDVKQSDIAMHSFNLTNSGYLPKEIIAECSRNPDIWWEQKK